MATILIADDSTTIRKVVQSVLGAAGHTVLGAVQGREALELARARRPDLVLCDVLMPELTGYEVAEALRHEPDTRPIPIVLLFGAFEPFDEERAARCGAVGHLAKPFEPKQLLRRVEELLLAYPARPVVAEPLPLPREGEPGPVLEATIRPELRSPAGEAEGEAPGEAPLDLPSPLDLPWGTPVPLPGDDAFDLEPAPLDTPAVVARPDLDAVIRDEVRRRLTELAPEIVREVAWEVV
ncbi:MAG: response regulator, partial [Acidobacteria bacterium]|nr:response regulator [Acidobacteriota bacterium]